MGTFPVNVLSKQNCAMLLRMKKPPGIKVRSYAACIIDLNEYLSVLPVAKESDKICETEFNNKKIEHRD